MKNNIIQISEVKNFRKFLGSKTINLKRCVDLGFAVPKFVAIPSDLTGKLFSDKNLIEEISREVQKNLKGTSYAVRSSALIEDGEKHSYAGQFLTKINIGGNNLSQAIFEVLKQANDFLKGDLNKFSLIIQEYIVADVSGVTFTRNPNGGREMVIEYGFCEGEKIVSGEIKPEKMAFYWGNSVVDVPKKLELLVKELKTFKELERKNNFPQDIEWCLKNNQFYLLQTRPITTITEKQYQQIIFLENILAKENKFYFEKTEISEIAPRPTMVTFNLLKSIYAEGGPVKKIYEKYGISYLDTDFLKIIGNELFVDKDREIRSLLPAYSYLNNKLLIPKVSSLSGIGKTIKNLFFLNKIKTGGYEKLFESLKNKIGEKNEYGYEDSLKIFLHDYELIFEVNLLAGLAIKKLSVFIKNEKINLSEIIDGGSLFVDFKRYQVALPQNLKGNSLELSDDSPFVAREEIKKKRNEKVEEWWENLSEYKRKVLEIKIKEAIIYNRLRELGRWLTLIKINNLRNTLLTQAKELKFKEEGNIFFSDLVKRKNNEVNEADCIKNKTSYEEYNQYAFPNELKFILVNKKSKIQGVSSGIAEGILLKKEEIKEESAKSKKIILYTEILSPELTKYFKNIRGIISNSGGALSHLAIVAREQNIPVIVGFSVDNSEIKIGNNVRMNGDTGEIVDV